MYRSRLVVSNDGRAWWSHRCAIEVERAVDLSAIDELILERRSKLSVMIAWEEAYTS